MPTTRCDYILFKKSCKRIQRRRKNLNNLNKNITELLDVNDSKITDAKQILEMQTNFYQDLFSSKNTMELKNSTFAPLLQNLPILSDFLREKLEQPFSLTELEDSIKRSKLNKAPGPDGYTNEFFKFFKEELKTWLFRAISFDSILFLWLILI